MRSLIRKPETHRPDAPVVEFRGVTIHYGDGKPALEDASFALPGGKGSPSSAPTARARARC